MKSNFRELCVPSQIIFDFIVAHAIRILALRVYFTILQLMLSN